MTQRFKPFYNSNEQLAYKETTLQTITGRLLETDFESRCITLEYPPTKTKIKCYYTNELKVELLNNRLELLQITGNVTYKQDHETPQKITDIKTVEFIDLSDFILQNIQYDKTKLIFQQPLTMTPNLTESHQFMTLQNFELGIDVIAQTRNELWEELLTDIKIQWEHCAKLPNEKLSKEFIKQKNNLLKLIKEEQI
jgi:hypothetical protein